VQIVEKRSGLRRILEHVGSAYTDPELAVLMQAARERSHERQLALDLDLGSDVDAGKAGSDRRSSGGSLAGAVDCRHGQLGVVGRPRGRLCPAGVRRRRR
jgi:hypothetical protein